MCFNCFLSSHIIFLSSVLLNQSRSSRLQVAPPFWFWTTVLDSPTEGSQKSGTVRFAILVPFIMEMQIIAYHTGTILYCTGRNEPYYVCFCNCHFFLLHRFIFEDYTPTNFDTFPASIMTVFQVWNSKTSVLF